MTEQIRQQFLDLLNELIVKLESDRAARIAAINAEFNAEVGAIEELKKKFPNSLKAVGFLFVNQKGERINSMEIHVDKKGLASIKPVDKFENPARVDGAPSWKLADESLGSVAASEDGLSAQIQPSGKVGSCELLVEGDADLGEGVEKISASANLAFLGGKAVALVLEVAEVE